MNILLININTGWFGNKYFHDIPYGLCIIKAALRDDHEVKILDANYLNLSERELAEEIRNSRADVVGISCMSYEYRKALVRTAEIAKSAIRSIKVVTGGVYPTLLPEEIIHEKSIDFAVMGEGEFRFKRLLHSIENNNIDLESIDGIAYVKNRKVIIQPVTDYIADLDNSPFPDYSDIDFDEYSNFASKYNFYIYPRRFPYAKTITSRGCPFRCIFCGSRFINGSKIRFRSAENVLGEIEWLVEDYGIREIIFLDDNWIVNRQRSVNILNGLKARKYDLTWKAATNAPYALDDELLELMRETGCYQLNLAIESGSERSLKLMRKPLKLEHVRNVVRKAKEMDFEITGGFIFGLPGETWEDIRMTFEFADELDLDYCAFNIANPLPRTDLLDICRKKDYLVNDFEFSDTHFNGFGLPNIRTPEFDPGELLVLRAFEWDRINFRDEFRNERIARINGIDIDDVPKWRKDTRVNALKLLGEKIIQN